jgi:8-hydroxy-5-deazaflavin:NADPH oxidoreductase
VRVGRELRASDALIDQEDRYDRLPLERQDDTLQPPDGRDHAHVARGVGGQAQIGTFADAAAFGEIVFDCTNGAYALAALRQAGAANLRGKILIQVGNPLDTSKGLPRSLTVCNTESLGEQVQREFPDTRVVKALNTVNCDIMVDPERVPGDHNLFICGNDAAAKREVINRLCEWFGWKPSNIIDLGDITNSRGTEMFLALWLRLWASWARHTSTSTSYAEPETVAGRIASGQS